MENTIILKGETKPLTTAEPGENGDKYWLRKFNTTQNIHRCRHRWRKSREEKLWLGLDLWRAKLNLDHGAWYPYLHCIPMNPVTAWRHMDFAHKFMAFVKIIPFSWDKPNECNIASAMELLYSKSFIMKDFFDHLDSQIDPNDYLPDGSTRDKSPVDAKIWGVDLWRDLHRIDHKLQKEFLGWTPEEQRAGLDYLDSVIRQLTKFQKEARALRRGVTMTDMQLEVGDEPNNITA